MYPNLNSLKSRVCFEDGEKKVATICEKCEDVLVGFDICDEINFFDPCRREGLDVGNSENLCMIFFLGNNARKRFNVTLLL